MRKIYISIFIIFLINISSLFLYQNKKDLSLSIDDFLIELERKIKIKNGNKNIYGRF